MARLNPPPPPGTFRRLERGEIVYGVKGPSDQREIFFEDPIEAWGWAASSAKDSIKPAKVSTYLKASVKDWREGPSWSVATIQLRNKLLR